MDGTLLPRSLEQWFVAFLVRGGLLRPAKAAADYCRAVFRGQARTWFDLKLRYLAGVPVLTVHEWALECWRTVVERRVFCGMVGLIAGLREAGLHLVLLSGAPEFLVQPLAEYLGIEECLCAKPAVVDCAMTGGLVCPHPRGRRKVEEAQRWLGGHLLAPAQACAVGDHWDDRFLLSFVGRAAVVTPGPRLALMARRRSWAIITDPSNPTEAVRALHRLLCLDAQHRP